MALHFWYVLGTDITIQTSLFFKPSMLKNQCLLIQMEETSVFFKKIYAFTYILQLYLHMLWEKWNYILCDNWKLSKTTAVSPFITIKKVCLKTKRCLDSNLWQNTKKFYINFSIYDPVILFLTRTRIWKFEKICKVSGWNPDRLPLFSLSSPITLHFTK